MFVLCVLYSKDKRQSQDNQDKAVQIKYRQRTERNSRYGDSLQAGRPGVRILPVAWMFMLCAVNKDKRQNAGQSRQRHRYGKVQTEFKKITKIRINRILVLRFTDPNW